MDKKSGKSHKLEQNALRRIRMVLRVSTYKNLRILVFRLLTDQDSGLLSKVSFLIMILTVMCTYVNFLTEDDENKYNSHISQSSSIIFHYCTKLTAEA